MIQAVNSTNSYKASNANNTAKTHPNFGNRRGSKASNYIGARATDFAMGAVVSTVFEVLRNVWNKAFKSGGMMPAKGIAIQAAFVGTAFAVIGGISHAYSSYKNRNR